MEGHQPAGLYRQTEQAARRIRENQQQIRNSYQGADSHAVVQPCPKTQGSPLREGHSHEPPPKKPRPDRFVPANEIAQFAPMPVQDGSGLPASQVMKPEDSDARRRKRKCAELIARVLPKEQYRFRRIGEALTELENARPVHLDLLRRYKSPKDANNITIMSGGGRMAINAMHMAETNNNEAYVSYGGQTLTKDLSDLGLSCISETHADPQLLLHFLKSKEDSIPPMGDSRCMCEECQVLFAEAAVKHKVDITVADPSTVHVFHPDGISRIGYFSTNPLYRLVVPGPRTSTRTTTDRVHGGICTYLNDGTRIDYPDRSHATEKESHNGTVEDGHMPATSFTEPAGPESAEQPRVTDLGSFDVHADELPSPVVLPGAGSAAEFPATGLSPEEWEFFRFDAL